MMEIDSTRLLIKGLLNRIRESLIQWTGGVRTGSPGKVMRAVAAESRFADRPRFPVPRNSGSARVTPPIAYRIYQPGDERSIMQGFNEAFQLARDTGYWRWKFGGRGKPMAMLAVDAGGVVQAQFAGVRLDWIMEGTRVPVVQICDLFARRHPYVIRENVMLRTMAAFHEAYAGKQDIGLVFGFPNRTALKLHGTLRPSFASARPVQTYRRIIGDRPDADAGAVAGSVTKGVPSRDAFDDLWSRAAERYGCAAPRNAGWFHWRFHDRPDVNDYVPMSCVRGDGSLAAWLVLRREGDTLWICDLVWDGVSKVDLEWLDNAVAVETVRLGVCENGIWLQGDSLAQEVLLGRGWIDRSADQTIYPAMHVYDPALDAAEMYSRLYLTLADSDLI